MFAIEIDPNTGLWQRDIPNHPENQIGPGFPQYLTTPVPSGFELPQWDGAQWVEGANDAERIPHVRSRRIRSVRAEGLTRIQTVFPAITDIDLIDLVTAILTSIVPAALSLNADLVRCRDIKIAARDAIVALNGMSALADLLAYDPETDPNWPPE